MNSYRLIVIFHRFLSTPFPPPFRSSLSLSLFSGIQFPFYLKYVPFSAGRRFFFEYLAPVAHANARRDSQRALKGMKWSRARDTDLL